VIIFLQQLNFVNVLLTWTSIDELIQLHSIGSSGVTQVVGVSVKPARRLGIGVTVNIHSNTRGVSHTSGAAFIMRLSLGVWYAIECVGIVRDLPQWSTT
jgi:hypothetical protein